MQSEREEFLSAHANSLSVVSRINTMVIGGPNVIGNAEEVGDVLVPAFEMSG